MPHMDDATYERLTKNSELYLIMKSDVREATKFLLAAGKCGYTDANQKDALIGALSLLTQNDKKLMEALMDIPIRGRMK